MISLLHSRHLVYDLDFEAQFGRARIAGCAFKANHHELYHLKLNLFEDKVYFVVRNKLQQDSSDFLVLSRLSLPHHFNSEKNHFQIGEGKRTPDGKQIQLYLYDLDRYYAIELNAQDYHFNEIKNKNIKENYK